MDVKFTHEQLVYALNHIHHPEKREMMREVVQLVGYGALLNKGVHAETMALNQTRARLNSYLDSGKFGQAIKEVAIVNPAYLGLDEAQNARVLEAKVDEFRGLMQVMHFGFGTQEEFMQAADAQRHKVALDSMVVKSAVAQR